MSHADQNKTTNSQVEHRIIPGGVVPTGQPTIFDSIKSGFGLFGGLVVKKELTEFERCLAEHREDIAYCAQFAEKK
jgi:hypothetical protein